MVFSGASNHLQCTGVEFKVGMVAAAAAATAAAAVGAAAAAAAAAAAPPAAAAAGAGAMAATAFWYCGWVASTRCLRHEPQGSCSDDLTILTSLYPSPTDLSCRMS